jgi:hypothetical protein
MAQLRKMVYGDHELYKFYNEPHIVKGIKVGLLRWLEHLFRIQE